jgi:RNA polymerase sigma-70 factor (ECF subfamily)
VWGVSMGAAARGVDADKRLAVPSKTVALGRSGVAMGRPIPCGRRWGGVNDLDASEDALSTSVAPGTSLSPPTASAVGDVAETILMAARRGDHQAFATIVEHYDRRLRALAFHVLRDPETLDDVLQEAYVKAYRGLATFHGSSSLGTWLFRLTYTTCLNVMRERSRQPVGAEREAPDRGDRSADPAELVAESHDFFALLGPLSPEQRAVIVLVDAQGHTYTHAAEILGIPLGTVASRLSSAHAALRGQLSTTEVGLAADAREGV